MNPFWNLTALTERLLIKFDIPSGPNLSIIEPSIFFQKNLPKNKFQSPKFCPQIKKFSPQIFSKKNCPKNFWRQKIVGYAELIS